MYELERLYRIDNLIANTQGGVVSKDTLLSELGISWTTLKRDLAFLRDRLNAPIVFDRDAGGYRFDKPHVGPTYQLPGLWFNAREAHALLTMHQMLSELEADLLKPHIAPLLSRLEAILGSKEGDFKDISRQVRLLPIGTRPRNPVHFATISHATLNGKRIRVTHYNRSDNTCVERELSPLRLSFYRNNWYLEAWCHLREALRRFSIDAVEKVQLIDTPAKIVEATQLDEEFGGSYGIFSGKPAVHAVLRFSEEAARWVADEQWRTDQVGTFNEDGTYTLEIPYANPTELAMDILRWGERVEVLEPAELRQKIRQILETALQQYAEPETPKVTGKPRRKPMEP